MILFSFSVRREAPIARRYSGGKDIGAACGTLEASQRGGVVWTGEAA